MRKKIIKNPHNLYLISKDHVNLETSDHNIIYLCKH